MAVLERKGGVLEKMPCRNSSSTQSGGVFFFFEKKIKKQLDYRASELHREEIADIKSFVLI